MLRNNQFVNAWLEKTSDKSTTPTAIESGQLLRVAMFENDGGLASGPDLYPCARPLAFDQRRLMPSCIQKLTELNQLLRTHVPESASFANNVARIQSGACRC